MSVTPPLGFLWSELWRDKSVQRAGMNWIIHQWQKDFKGLVLDLGCGNDPSEVGRISRENGAKYVGVDIDFGCQPEIAANLNDPLPIGSNAVDAVVIANCFYIVMRPGRLLEEAHRVLKPQGSIFLMAPLIWQYCPEPKDYWRFTAEAVDLLLREAGFSEIQIFSVGGRWASSAHLISPFIHPGRILRPLVHLTAVALDTSFRRASAPRWPGSPAVLRESEEKLKHPKCWAKDIVLGTLSVLVGNHQPDLNVVLLYHSVGGKVPRAVSTESLRRQLHFLKSNFQVVTLSEMCRLAAGNRSLEKKRLATITFDDGALDNYTQAFPALEQAGLKATFFIVTGCIGGKYAATYYETPAMSQSQIKDLFAHGHEVGAHSVSHPHLTRIPREHVIAEMNGSKSHLEDLTSHAVTALAYPFGDTNGLVRDCAHEAGFTCAADTFEALCPRNTVDWLEVPRVGVDGTVGLFQFRGKVSPALETYEGLRGRRGGAGHFTFRAGEPPSR